MVDAALRRRVRDRAGELCEYCQLPQHAVELTFHVEHVIARQHGGRDDFDNLSLACDRCNLNKGPNLTTIDSASGEVVRLFHPRLDAWADHFEHEGPQVVGKTPAGRATVELLRMNSARRRELRVRLIAEGSAVE